MEGWETLLVTVNTVTNWSNIAYVHYWVMCGQVSGFLVGLALLFSVSAICCTLFYIFLTASQQSGESGSRSSTTMENTLEHASDEEVSSFCA